MNRKQFMSASLLATGGLVAGFEKAKATTASPDEISSVPSKLALTPPMGWNSFDSYGVYLHHDAAIENLRAFAEKLLPHGYEYFVIDGGWYGEFELVPGTLYPKEKHARRVNMNEYGIYQPSQTYFPKGFELLMKEAKKLGIKMGIHLMRGVPRAAVEGNLPIKNSKYRTSEIADKERTCTWNEQNYGVDSSKPGAQEWYNAVVAQIAEWGFALIKYDDLTPYHDEILLVARAMETASRRMILSLSPGGGIYKVDMPFYRSAHMLRISVDIWDRREDIDKGFAAWKKFQGIAHQGFWPDLDMIPFGQLQLMSPPKYDSGKNNDQLAGVGTTRKSMLTEAQMRTFITMRALAASPLFAGGDLPSLDSYSEELLTNKDMIACNQNGQCAINVYEKDNLEVWITQNALEYGKGWIGIFNRNMHETEYTLNRMELGLAAFAKGYILQPSKMKYNLKNIWKQEKTAFTQETLWGKLEADDVDYFYFEFSY